MNSKKVLISVVSAICLMPGIVFLGGGKQVFPINENRVLNKLPEGSTVSLITDQGEYASGLQDYFNDRFGFRDLMIRTKNEIKYRIFGDLDEIYIDDNGYLYYKSVIDREQIGNEYMTDQNLSDTLGAIHRLKDYCDNGNAVFYFMVPPQKNETFPDRMVDVDVQRPEYNKYLMLRDMIKEDSQLNDDFIDSIEILREAESSYPTFYKTDFHWDAYGANVAFAPIVNGIAQSEGFTEPVFGTDSYTVSTMEFRGGQLDNIPLLENWYEMAIITTKNGDITSERTGEELPNGALHWVNKDENAPLGTILLIGDSYTQWMYDSNSGLLDCFKEVYYVHLDSSRGTLKNYEGMYDYLVFERIESGMTGITGYIDGLFAEE